MSHIKLYSSTRKYAKELLYTNIRWQKLHPQLVFFQNNTRKKDKIYLQNSPFEIPHFTILAQFRATAFQNNSSPFKISSWF
jgi:hypothetical protein